MVVVARSHLTEPALASDDERRLAVQARTDRAAFGFLYDRYVRRVYGYCLRRLSTPEAAEDATSLIFIKALAGMATYRDDGPSFASWLFAIAHNVVVDQVRARRADQPLESVHLLVDAQPGPEEVALHGENLRVLRTLLQRLSPDQRDVVELRLAGLTDIEIAHVLGRSHGAVRVAQHRALHRLQALAGMQETGRQDG